MPLLRVCGGCRARLPGASHALRCRFLRWLSLALPSTCTAVALRVGLRVPVLASVLPWRGWVGRPGLRCEGGQAHETADIR